MAADVNAKPSPGDPVLAMLVRTIRRLAGREVVVYGCNQLRMDDRRRGDPLVGGGSSA